VETAWHELPTKKRCVAPHWQTKRCTGLIYFGNNGFLPKSKQNFVYKDENLGIMVLPTDLL